MLHVLKVAPEHFDAVASGVKPFDVRRNDRPFRVGDMLQLRDYINGDDYYTGRVVQKAITYILDDPHYCLCGYVILGLRTPEQEGNR